MRGTATSPSLRKMRTRRRMYYSSGSIPRAVPDQMHRSMYGTRAGTGFLLNPNWALPLVLASPNLRALCHPAPAGHCQRAADLVLLSRQEPGRTNSRRFQRSPSLLSPRMSPRSHLQRIETIPTRTRSPSLSSRAPGRLPQTRPSVFAPIKDRTLTGAPSMLSRHPLAAAPAPRASPSRQRPPRSHRASLPCSSPRSQ